MDDKLHDFQQAVVSTPTGGKLVCMECIKCGFWTSDMEVLNDRLVSFWVRGENSPIYLRLNCIEYQMNKVVNG